MYVVKTSQRDLRSIEYDYVFKDFTLFYEIAECLTVSIRGKYKICIQSENINDIQEFLKVERKYSHLILTIYTSKNVAEYLCAYNPNLNIQESKSMYQVYIDLLRERKLLIDKQAMRLLYASIGHTEEELVSALDLILHEYGEQTLVTEKELASLFPLNKVTYPRSVLIAYLQLDRWRHVQLKKCLESMGNDVVLHAMIKNIKSLVEEKIVYLKTGQGNYLAKEIPTYNLFLMYRALVVERCSMNDIQIILNLYERGKTINDFIRE